MAFPSTEERVSRLEGGYDHLATKADVESVRVEIERLRADAERFRADFARWMLQFGIAIAGVIVGAVGVGVAILKLTG